MCYYQRICFTFYGVSRLIIIEERRVLISASPYDLLSLTHNRDSVHLKKYFRLHLEVCVFKVVKYR